MMKPAVPQKKIIIIGASSGIGRALALRYLALGHLVGITARRLDKLLSVREQYPKQTFCREMDVTTTDSIGILNELIREMDGMDLIIYCAGVGDQNATLDPEVEMRAIYTNVKGFSRIIISAYNYFKTADRAGQLVSISSLSGIKALRQSPAYSASKRFQMHYLSCLAQRASKEKMPLIFSTILPGFIRTDFIRRDYPLSISLEKGANLIFKAIEKRKRIAIIPGRWRPIALVWRLIPNRIWEKIW